MDTQLGWGSEFVQQALQLIVSNEQTRCLIWDSPVSRVWVSTDGTVTVCGSVRADGDYMVSPDAIEAVRALGDAQKARLTYRLIKARKQGSATPVVDKSLVDGVRAAATTSVHERAVQLLDYIATSSERVGEFVNVITTMDQALAWSESIEQSEFTYLVLYLEEKEWIIQSPSQPGWGCRVTVDGYSYLEERRFAPALSQAFVAMWFDPTMEPVYTDGIKPAIERAGYAPLRIDRLEHINKIDDEVIRELRRSRFIVADFTSGADGARGSVYYEAGFARGLGIPVIGTCRSNQIGEIHFDTRQYAHIPWSNPSELRVALEVRIGAVIGEGPHTLDGTYFSQSIIPETN